MDEVRHKIPVRHVLASQPQHAHVPGRGVGKGTRQSPATRPQHNSLHVALRGSGVGRRSTHECGSAAGHRQVHRGGALERGAEDSQVGGDAVEQFGRAYDVGAQLLGKFDFYGSASFVH